MLSRRVTPKIGSYPKTARLVLVDHLPSSAWAGHIPFAFWIVHRPLIGRPSNSSASISQPILP